MGTTESSPSPPNRNRRILRRVTMSLANIGQDRELPKTGKAIFHSQEGNSVKNMLYGGYDADPSPPTLPSGRKAFHGASHISAEPQTCMSVRRVKRIWPFRAIVAPNLSRRS